VPVGVEEVDRGMMIFRNGGVDWDRGIVGTSVCWVGMAKGWGFEEGIEERLGLRTVEGYSSVVGSSCFFGERVVLKFA
jgi:hypothetical protein